MVFAVTVSIGLITAIFLLILTANAHRAMSEAMSERDHYLAQWQDVLHSKKNLQKELTATKALLAVLKTRLTTYQQRELEDAARKAEWAKEQTKPPRRVIRRKELED